MSNLSNSIRHKRYRIKPGSSLELILELPTGQRLEIDVRDCSVFGLGGLCKCTEGPELLQEGEIVPQAKLVWGKDEYPLGRLVYRQTKTDKEGTFVGFSTVDQRVPLAGKMSRILEVDEMSDRMALPIEMNPEKFTLSAFTNVDEGNVDIFARCRQFQVMYREWQRRPRFLYHTVRTPSKGTRVRLEHRRSSGSRDDYIIMGSNDYFGLAAHPEVIEAARKAIDEYGFGSTGAPLSTGQTRYHDELSDYLARMYRKDRCILYNSGFSANIGSIPSLTGESDLILADMLCHASIQDALGMSRAGCRFFKHNNMSHLEKLLKDKREDHSGCLLVTEGIFSMDGDTPPLDEFVELARTYNARTFVDEAHSMGICGPSGLGACDQYGVTNDIDLIMGTFSKICGGIGGFVVGDREVIEWLTFFSRSYMFSVTLPPSTAAASLKALQIVATEPNLRLNLKKNVEHFCDGLRRLGCPVSPDHQSSIIPVEIGDEKKLGIMTKVLFESGVYVIPVVYPVVSRDRCRFRFTIMTNHTLSDLDYVLNILEKAMEKAEFRFAEIAAPRKRTS